MKKQWIAWGLIAILSVGEVLENSSISWALSNGKINEAFTATSSNAKKVQDTEMIEFSTPSNGEELATSGNTKEEDIIYATASNVEFSQIYKLDDGIIMSLDLQEVILPDDTEIRVNRVRVSDKAEQQLKTILNMKNKKVSSIYAYDISFWSEEKEFEPGDGVKVTFQVSKEVMTQPLEEIAEIFHIKDGTEQVEIVQKNIEDEHKVSCESIGFSIYGLVLTETEEWEPIYTAQDLQNIENNLSGKYKLMNDIDLSGIDWVALGDQWAPFRGVLDGQNYELRNLTVHKQMTWEKQYGLFDTLEGTVKNLKIDSFHITLESGADYLGNLNLGIIAGQQKGKSAAIYNCNIKRSEINTNSEVCEYIGGVVGWQFGGVISQSSFDGNINCRGESEDFVIGGIAGRTDSEISNCINYGDVNAEVLGGFNDEYIGGISGFINNANLNATINHGDIAVEKNSTNSVCVGGILGAGTGKIIDCYNTGNVEISKKQSDLENEWENSVGGIIGLGASVRITTSYNVGNIIEKNETLGAENAKYVGGIIGNGENSFAKDCYDISEKAIGYEGTGKFENIRKCDQLEMLQQSTYQGFDFDNVWVMGYMEYPYARLQFENDEWNSPILPDIPETNDEKIGWTKFQDGKVGYYEYKDGQYQLLKDGVYTLIYTDDNNVLFTGKWCFDQDGYVVTGMKDGYYYWDDNDAIDKRMVANSCIKYPYGIQIPAGGLREILNQHLRPSSVIQKYDYLDTFMNDLNVFSYYLSANPDTGMEEIFDVSFQAVKKLAKNGYVNWSDLNPMYLRNQTNNKKFLKEVIETKFAENYENMEDSAIKGVGEFLSVSKSSRDKMFDMLAEDYTDLLKEKRKQYKEKGGEWSESFEKLMKKMDEDGNADAYYAYITKNSIGTLQKLFENAAGWRDVFKDYTDKINYLKALRESVNRVDISMVSNKDELIQAIDELQDNYEKRVRNQLQRTIFDMIEKTDSWVEILTGKSRILNLLDWDFDGSVEINTNKAAADIAARLLGEKLPLYKDLNAIVKTLQSIDGRPSAINSVAESQMLYETAYQILRTKEDSLKSSDATSVEVAEYMDAFDFFKYITIIRYKNMKKLYESLYNRDGLKKMKAEFLSKEIEKLEQMTPLNYFEEKYASLEFTGKWDDVEQRYYYAAGSNVEYYLKDTWAWIDGNRYYFDQEGHVLTGLQVITDTTGQYQYYFSKGSGSEPDQAHYGAMQTGVLNMNGQEYYFYPKNGHKAEDCIVDIGAGKYHYYGSDGVYDPMKHPERLVPSAFSKDEQGTFENGATVYKINCPVDVFVYDNNGKQIGSIKSEQVNESNEVGVKIFIDSSGQKTVVVPYDSKYELEIIAQNDGIMDYSVTQYASDGTGFLGRTDYRAIPLKRMDHFYGITETAVYDNEERTLYHLLKDTDEINESEYQTAQTVYTIETVTDGMGAVTGNVAAIRGDFAKLSASAAQGYQFKGWYDESGLLVSDEAVYRFRVLKNEKVIAKFEHSKVIDIEDKDSQNKDMQKTFGHWKDSENKDTQRGIWIKDEKGWWYKRNDRTWPVNEWCELEYQGRKDWYYFNADGYVMDGWIYWNGQYYYLNPLSNGWYGKMKVGWQQIDGKWYYFEPNAGKNKGHLYKNTITPDGYKVNENGVWDDEF